MERQILGRAGMVDDPLARSWSTYRDAVGLSLRPVRARHPDPETTELARQLGTSPSTLRRLPAADRHVEQVARLCGDLRFPGIPTGRGYWTRR